MMDSQRKRYHPSNTLYQNQEEDGSPLSFGRAMNLVASECDVEIASLASLKPDSTILSAAEIESGIKALEAFRATAKEALRLYVNAIGADYDDDGARARIVEAWSGSDDEWKRAIAEAAEVNEYNALAI